MRTLEVAAIVVCSVLGPVSAAFGPGQARLRPARFWGAGLIALAGALALLTLGDSAPAYVAHVVGPGLVALALTLAQSSALTAGDENARDVPGWILLGVVVLGLHGLERTTSDAWLHHVVGMGTLGLLCFRVACGFDRSRGMREGRALRAIAAIFGLFGLLMLLDGAHALASAGPEHVAGAGVAAELMRVGLIAGLLLGTILLLWVMTERADVRIRRIASLDPLTGTLIRQAFIKWFEREAAQAMRRADARFALLLIDVDHFRRINDAWGNRAGDRLLAAIAGVVRTVIRDYDLVGRLEGDVFAVLMRGSSGAPALAMAERIRLEIERQAAARASLRNPVTVSVGVAVYSEHGRRWDEVMRAARAAARSAKADRGNRVIEAVPALRPVAVLAA